MTHDEAGRTADGPDDRRRSFPLYAQILLAMAVGVVTGVVLGPRAGVLGQFGTIVIQLIRVMAAPLLFFAIVDAFLRTDMEARRGLWLVAICAINTALALVVGLSISNWIRPGEHMTLALPAAAAAPKAPLEKLDFVKALTGYVPTNILQPFLET